MYEQLTFFENSSNNIRLAGIDDDSIVNGTGVRTVIFTQGCPHHCPKCHNKKTWDPKGGYIENIENICKKIEQNIKIQTPLISGVTFSGGEPFYQEESCYEIAKFVKKLGLNIWTYTGYIYEQLIQDYHPLLDITNVLVDGKFEIEKKDISQPFIGSTNQRIIDVQASKNLTKTNIYYNEIPSLYSITLSKYRRD